MSRMGLAINKNQQGYSVFKTFRSDTIAARNFKTRKKTKIIQHNKKQYGFN